MEYSHTAERRTTPVDVSFTYACVHDHGRHADRPDLLTLLASVSDPRTRRGVRHPLPAILAVGLAAVLAGARSIVAIGEWVGCQSTQTLTQLGVSGQGPGESTIRRTFSRLEADVLDRILGAHVDKTRVVGGRRVIAIDGKTVRGARTKTTTAPHLVAAFDHHAGAVLGQVAVAAKSNEIPAVRDLLTLFDLSEQNPAHSSSRSYSARLTRTSARGPGPAWTGPSVDL